MNLSDLRPTQPTELALLSVSLQGATARAAAPSALPEHFLISVARDLRKLENNQQDENLSSYLAAPMMLVFFIHMNSKSTNAEFTMSENSLYRSLHVYQRAIEREIINRLIGFEGGNDERVLFEEFEEIRDASE